VVLIFNKRVSPDQLSFAPTGPVGIVPDGSVATPMAPVTVIESELMRTYGEVLLEAGEEVTNGKS